MFRTLLIALIAGLPFSASASNYPPSFWYQNVTVRSEGSALLAEVSSGFMSVLVLGYRYDSKAFGTNPDVVDAVIVGECRTHDGSSSSKKTVVQLGREWNGAGYLSSSLGSTLSFYPDNCFYGETSDRR